MNESQECTSPVITCEELNPQFKYEIKQMPGAESLMVCFQCGTCTADCPTSKYSSFYQPRRIARMVQLGLKDQLLSDQTLWLCTTCRTCVDHCPQGVDIAGIVRVLRNLTVEEKGIMPSASKELASNILETGYVYNIPRSRRKRRTEIGLPPLPKSNVNDIEKLFQVTESSNLVTEIETFEEAES